MLNQRITLAYWNVCFTNLVYHIGFHGWSFKYFLHKRFHPQVLIAIILLLSWTDFYKDRDHLDAIDCFAGAARVAKVARAFGHKAVALDIGYHPNSRVFDVNSDAGFSLLAWFDI